MSTGLFHTDKVLCCPYCGNSKRCNYRDVFRGSKSFSVTTQGRGSGEHEVVCDACGFDGGVQTIGQAKTEPYDVPAPKYCLMCGSGALWVMGSPWALSCTGCGWIGSLHAYDEKHGGAD